MTAKNYLERKIKEVKKDIENLERYFNECAEIENKDYEAIIRMALHIKSKQDELKGMEKSLEIISDFEEIENNKNKEE